MAGVYVHIPFCRQICHYCDFHRSGSLALKGAVLERIGRELGERAREIRGSELKTLYFGGGTPSVCTPQEIGRLIEQLRTCYPEALLEEITLEANPDDLTPRYLGELLEVGVNRLSLGVQSFVDEHLRRMNRRHDAAQAVEAVRRAQRAGFRNITIDLIYGLPFMTCEQWEQNLQQAVALQVQHISAYHLTIEPKTHFAKQGLEPVSDDVSQEHFRLLRQVLGGAGFEHYEVSNFALPGYRSRHNSSYWDDTPYLGLGPAAHSYNGTDLRRWTPPTADYLAGKPAEQELLTPAERLEEYLLTRLRTARGAALDRLPGEVLRKAAPLLESGMLRRVGDRLAVPPEHFLMSDYLIRRLLPDE